MPPMTSTTRAPPPFNPVYNNPLYPGGQPGYDNIYPGQRAGFNNIIPYNQTGRGLVPGYPQPGLGLDTGGVLRPSPDLGLGGHLGGHLGNHLGGHLGGHLGQMERWGFAYLSRR